MAFLYRSSEFGCEEVIAWVGVDEVSNLFNVKADFDWQDAIDTHI